MGLVLEIPDFYEDEKDRLRHAEKLISNFSHALTTLSAAVEENGSLANINFVLFATSKRSIFVIRKGGVSDLTEFSVAGNPKDFVWTESQKLSKDTKKAYFKNSILDNEPPLLIDSLFTLQES